jgi:hypothetical protein
MMICLGALMDEIEGGCRKMRNEKPRKLHAYPYMIFWIGHLTTLLLLSIPV